jgi:hypothetical protein
MKTTIKILGAGILAMLILSLPCFLYYYVPLTIPTIGEATDWIYEKNSRYSRAVEGYGYGRINNEGFANIDDYNSQPVDILLMGSSQMEGLQVPQREGTAVLLNNFFGAANYVYNISMSGHTFSTVVKNFKSAVTRYKPRKYVIIETSSIRFDAQTLDDMINGNVQWKGLESNIKGPIAALRKTFLKNIPYIRLLSYQVSSFRSKGNADIYPAPAKEGNTEEQGEEYAKGIDRVLRNLNRICGENKVKLIIFYHVNLALNQDGTASAGRERDRTLFKSICENNDIHFIDMTGIFLAEYKNKRVLPYGFKNTAVGYGHLNKYGHDLIARELFRQINQLTEDAAVQ